MDMTERVFHRRRGGFAYGAALIALAAGAAGGGCLPTALNDPPDGGAGGAGGIGGGPVNMCFPDAPAACASTCLQAGEVLQQRCAICHASPNNHGTPPFDFVLDINRLVTTPWIVQGGSLRFVVPGHPEDSQIYVRAAVTRDMPPLSAPPSPSDFPRVSVSEASVLRVWIANCIGTEPPSGVGGAGATGGTPGTGGTSGAVDPGQPECPPPPPSADGGGGTSCPDVTYPPTGFYGQNIFYPGCKSLDSTVQSYEMAADVIATDAITVKMTLLEGPVWGISETDWRFTYWNDPAVEPGQQIFVPRFAGRNETRLRLQGSGRARIDYYECGSPTPTRSEVIVWNGP